MLKLSHIPDKEFGKLSKVLGQISTSEVLSWRRSRFLASISPESKIISRRLRNTKRRMRPQCLTCSENVRHLSELLTRSRTSLALATLTLIKLRAKYRSRQKKRRN